MKIRNVQRQVVTALLLGAGLLVTVTREARAEFYSFNCFHVGNASGDCTTGLAYSVNVAGGAGNATLAFANTSSTGNTVVSEIYFDYSDTAFLAASTSGSGTNFGIDGAQPPNLPSQNTYPGSPFVTDFGIDAESPSTNFGINNGETLNVVLNGITGDQLIAGLNNGSIRVGLHVQGLSLPSGGGTSAEYAIAPVPEPSTWAMLLAGLGMLGFMARRRAKQA